MHDNPKAGLDRLVSQSCRIASGLRRREVFAVLPPKGYPWLERLRSFCDQHWIWCELHDAIRQASDHSLMQRRIALRVNDKQVRVEIGGKPNNVPHRVAQQDMG